jgi:hypothetical protein
MKFHSNLKKIKCCKIGKLFLWENVMKKYSCADIGVFLTVDKVAKKC